MTTATVLAASFVIGTGCGNQDGDSTSAVQRSLVSVVGRHGDNVAQGSGVVVDRPQAGLIVTSDHLIEGVDSVEVTFHDGSSTLGRPVARAQCHDLALISVGRRPDDVRPISFANDAALQPGTAVTAWGYKPAGQNAGRLVNSEGALSAVDIRAKLHRRMPEVPGLLLHQAPLALELTGGPLTDETGDLVGINVLIRAKGSSSSVTLSKAVSGSYFRDALGELSPKSDGSYGGWEQRHACHGIVDDLARAARGEKRRTGPSAGHQGH